MARRVSEIATKTAHVIQLFNDREIDYSQAVRWLMKLALQSETVADLDFIRVAREAIDDIEEKAVFRSQSAM